MTESPDQAKTKETVLSCCRITLADWLLMTVLCVLSIAILLPFAGARKNEVITPAAAEAVIQVNGAMAQRVSLLQDGLETIAVPGGRMLVEVNDGRIRIHSADCRRQVCVKKGWINGRNDVIICVPNRVCIEIEEAETEEPPTYHVLTY